MKKIILVSNGNNIDDDLIYYRYARSLSLRGHDVTVIGISNKSVKLPYDKIQAIGLSSVHGRIHRLTVRLLEIESICMRLAEKDTLFLLFTIDLCSIGQKLAGRGAQVVQVFLENHMEKILGKVWIPRPIRPYIKDIFVKRQIKLGNICKSNIFVDRFTMEAYKKGIKKPCYLIPNFPLLLVDGSKPPQKTFDHRPLKMVYVGGIGHERGLQEMVRLAIELRDTVELHLYGKSPESDFEDWINKSQNVYYHGFFPYIEILQVLQEYDIGLFFPRKGVTFNYCAENTTKLFEYMYAGLPILCTDIKGLSQIIEQDTKTGLCVPIERFEAVLPSIKNFLSDAPALQNMSECGWHCARQKHNWEAIVETLFAAVE